METRTAPDEVYKFRFCDGNDILQKIVMEFTYRFDDLLDASKLKLSLERLLEIGEWKSLGARLKKDVGAVMVATIVRRILTTMTGNNGRSKIPYPASIRREETGLRLVTGDAEAEHKRPPLGFQDTSTF